MLINEESLVLKLFLAPLFQKIGDRVKGLYFCFSFLQSRWIYRGEEQRVRVHCFLSRARLIRPLVCLIFYIFHEKYSLNARFDFLFYRLKLLFILFQETKLVVVSGLVTPIVSQINSILTQFSI